MSKSNSGGPRAVWGPERVIVGGHSTLAARGAVVLGALLAVLPLPASAHDFPVRAGQTVGPQVMTDVGDRGVIDIGGTVSTSGDLVDAVWMDGDDQVLENAGTITTSGNRAYGIWSSGGGAIINNSGTIAASGVTAHGIYSNGGGAIVNNSGTIATSGVSSNGIYALRAAATVTNSGTIIAEQGDAIRFDTGGATLNLLAGSIIQGELRFAGTGNSLNFGPGLNAVVTLSGAGGVPVTAGSNPFVVSGNSVAVLDPTGFGLTDTMALGLAGDLATGTTRGPQHCLPVLGNDDCATTAWLGGFGSFGGQPGSATLGGFEQQRGGGLMGLDFASGGGIFVGAVAAHGRAGSAREASIQGGVAGGHARLALDDYFAEFYAALGILQLDNTRTVLNNTVVGGLEFAKASQTGHFFSPAMTLGRAFATDAGTLTPSLRLRYTGLQLGGYAETGASGLVVDRRMVHELELRAQLQLALPPVVIEGGTFSTTLRAGADLIHQRNADFSGQLLGQPIAFVAGGGGTRVRGFAAAEFNYALTGGTALFGSIQASLDTAGSYSGTAQAGLRGVF